MTDAVVQCVGFCLDSSGPRRKGNPSLIVDRLYHQRAESKCTIRAIASTIGNSMVIHESVECH